MRPTITITWLGSLSVPDSDVGEVGPRWLLARALEGGDHDLDVDLDAIRSSFGALTDVEPDERGPDERQRHLDRMWKLGA